METGCAAVEWATGSLVIVVVEVDVEVAEVVAEVVAVASTRIQHRTPKLRLRAPSTPTCKGKGSGGLLFLSSERRMLGVSYSSQSFGIKRSNPESGLAAVGKVVPQAASWIF